MSRHHDILSTPESRRAYEEELLYGEATETIGALLKSLKISHQEYATRLGVTPGRVSQMLSGKANLTLRTLAALAWALGMQVSLSFEPMVNRNGTPANEDPPPPVWLGRLNPTADVVYLTDRPSRPDKGRLDVRRQDLRRFRAA